MVVAMPPTVLTFITGVLAKCQNPYEPPSGIAYRAPSKSSIIAVPWLPSEVTLLLLLLLLGITYATSPLNVRVVLVLSLNEGRNDNNFDMNGSENVPLPSIPPIQ